MTDMGGDPDRGIQSGGVTAFSRSQLTSPVHLSTCTKQEFGAIPEDVGVI